ncbi:MAG: hypothetical protein WCJ40_21395, partial [Planctomycetota bacterium]
PGSSLVGAYRDYQKGSYVSAALNGLFGLADLATVGSLVKVRSSLKLLVGFMKVRVKDALADEAANQAGVAVAERLGPEAGFVTQIIVSATFSKNVSQQNKTQLGFADDGAKKIKGAFEIAYEGGKHSGFLKNYLGKPTEIIRKGIGSLQKQMAEHQDKIANP